MNSITQNAVTMTKARLGITSDARDNYIQAIVESIVSELEMVHDITLDTTNMYQLMFVVDWADWRYNNRDSYEGMPRHLRYRLNNMIVRRAVRKNGTV